MPVHEVQGIYYYRTADQIGKIRGMAADYGPIYVAHTEICSDPDRIGRKGDQK